VRHAAIVWISVECAASLSAQTPGPIFDARPTFEVASVKPSKTSGKPSLRVFPGGRTVGTNATLKLLIQLAYGVQDYQIAGGPKWIDSNEYDIDAKPAVAFQPSLDTREYARRMQQTLLEDRFGLSVSRTTRELPLYVLTVANSSWSRSSPRSAGEYHGGLPLESPHLLPQGGARHLSRGAQYSSRREPRFVRAHAVARL
jgi:hypothetical protein